MWRACGSVVFEGACNNAARLPMCLQVFSNPQQAAAKGAAARQHILAYFTLEGLASKVMSEIMRIQNKLGLNR